MFAVHDSGFYARSALEVADSAENRFEKIAAIIKGSRFGIHDISRTESNDEGLPRFNMPLELGLFLGCRRYGSAQDRRKVCLVLDRDQYRYQRFISDIAGQYVAAHKNEPRQAVLEVRGWLRTSSRRSGIPGGGVIWDRFQVFQRDLPAMCQEARISPAELTFADRTQLISNWLLENAP
ncbi:MAG: nucleotide-binding protein [Actinomycetota bacterium]|nr:nucleotide-binding protein [Actinomycetota bacterium]